jgi:hypothetical protein
VAGNLGGAIADADTGMSDRPVGSVSGPCPSKTWIEIQLLDETNQPVVGEWYRITLPNGAVRNGLTDSAGVGRIEGIDPGVCKITFPNLDKDAWETIAGE